MSLLEVSEFFCCSQSICVEFEGIIVAFFCKTFNLPKKNKFYNRETQKKKFTIRIANSIIWYVYYSNSVS